MKLKSYFSATVEAAMELARKELGEDALLMNARPATPETRYLGAYEVVFGVSQSAESVSPPAPTASVAPELSDPGRDFGKDLADLRRQLERLTLGASVVAPAPHSRSSHYDSLVAGELAPALAERLAQGANLATLFRTDPTLGCMGSTRKIVALVGPPGAGKTTTLGKLAVRYGLAGRRPAHILTSDVHRVAAADQLRSLASLLGIGCDIAETPLALAQQIEEHRLKDLILIDTPGLASSEMQDGEELARFLALKADIDTHLVLPASMKPADMARAAERYAIFRPSKLLFTKLDETSTFGPLVSLAAERDLPISFLCAGPQIPDDLEEATLQRFSDWMPAAAQPLGKGAAA